MTEQNVLNSTSKFFNKLSISTTDQTLISEFYLNESKNIFEKLFGIFETKNEKSNGIDSLLVSVICLICLILSCFCFYKIIYFCYVNCCLKKLSTGGKAISHEMLNPTAPVINKKLWIETRNLPKIQNFDHEYLASGSTTTQSGSRSTQNSIIKGGYQEMHTISTSTDLPEYTKVYMLSSNQASEVPITVASPSSFYMESQNDYGRPMFSMPKPPKTKFCDKVRQKIGF